MEPRRNLGWNLVKILHYEVAGIPCLDNYNPKGQIRFQFVQYFHRKTYENHTIRSVQSDIVTINVEIQRAILYKCRKNVMHIIFRTNCKQGRQKKCHKIWYT